MLLLLLLLLQALLLASTGVVRLHGDPSAVVSQNLECVNDYLYTINCTLSIQPPDGRYWLNFTDTHDRKVFKCPLTHANGEFTCSFKTHNPKPEDDDDNDDHDDVDDDDDDYGDETKIFQDTHRYEISLCHGREEGADACERLGAKYNPARNITPNAPRRLAVRRDSSGHLFTWTSTYEPYGEETALTEALVFQLRYYERGRARDPNLPIINTNQLNYSVADEHFVPNTKYAARVRSSPDQTHYMGHWSDWSAEVHWATGPAATDVHGALPSSTLVSGLVKVLVPLCVVVSFVLLFCCAPVKKWRQGALIPTPALYFLTPNADCQGDFKSWAVTEENTADMLKAEETLQIDTVTECDVPEEEEEEEEEEESKDHGHHQVTEGSVYNNVLLLGVPYAVSSMAPPSPPGSPAEGDSGCWMEKYCNEYCTLSAFQEKGPTGGGGPPTTKACPTGALRAEAVTEA